MTDKKHLSVWLCPCEKDSQMLFEIISKLSERFDAPLFTPHITLFSGILELKAFESFNFDQVAPFQVKLERLVQSDSYFQSTFCEVKNNPVFESLFAGLSKIIATSSIKMKQLHLSLIYGHFVDQEQEAIIKAINLELPQKISINKLSIVKTEGPVHTWKKISSVNL